ncbi:MAG: hypothetical protein WBK91_08980 [Alphaproteobacteria bacterium]
MKRVLLSTVAIAALVAGPALAGESRYEGHYRHSSNDIVNELNASQKMGATVQVQESNEVSSKDNWTIFEEDLSESTSYEKSAAAGKQTESSKGDKHSSSDEHSSAAAASEATSYNETHADSESNTYAESQEAGFDNSYHGKKGHHHGSKSGKESGYENSASSEASTKDSQSAVSETSARSAEAQESGKTKEYGSSYENGKSSEWAEAQEAGRYSGQRHVRDERHNTKVTTAKKSIDTGNVSVNGTTFGAGIFTLQNGTGKNSALNNASSVAAQLNESPDNKPKKGDLTNSIVSAQELLAQVSVQSQDKVQADVVESSVTTGDISYTGGSFAPGIFTINNNTGLNNAANNATGVAVQVNGAGILGN